MSKELHHFIGGKLVAGRNKRFGNVYDPTTGHITAQVPLASHDETLTAISVAEAAFPEWAATPVTARAQVMFQYRELLERHRNELADLITSEHGKIVSDAKGSVSRGIEVVEFACGIPHLIKGDYSANVSNGIDIHDLRQPLGVCAGITPFNFPVMVPLWMFPLAIACGNTFILKPSEKVPSSSLRLAELMMEAGLPDGVLNVINGDKETVDTLLEDSRVRALSFVGSTTVAKHIYATGCAFGKRVQALGGAKNHLVIMPDANIDKALEALMGAGYGSAGERCMAISVAVAVGSAAETLVERLKTEVSNLTIGPGTDPESNMGPLVTREHLKRVENYVNLGVTEGAELVVDGRNLSLKGFEDGFFMGGCLFDHVSPNMRIYREEIFGPVLSIVRVPTYESALSLVNSHEYGNGTAVFTKDGNTARNFANDVQTGMVGINVPIPVPLSFHTFGGWKNSLFGSANMYGHEGVRFYSQLKTITSRWPGDIPWAADFTMPTSR